jgi:hypothetical protein
LQKKVVTTVKKRNYALRAVLVTKVKKNKKNGFFYRNRILISFIFTQFQPHRRKRKESGDDGQKKKLCFEGSFGDQGQKKKKNGFFYRNRILISFIFTQFQPHRRKTKQSGDDGQKKKLCFEGSFGDQGQKKKKNVFFYRNHILTPQGMGKKKIVFHGTRTRAQGRNPYRGGLRPIFVSRRSSLVVRADDVEVTPAENHLVLRAAHGVSTAVVLSRSFFFRLR